MLNTWRGECKYHTQFCDASHPVHVRYLGVRPNVTVTHYLVSAHTNCRRPSVFAATRPYTAMVSTLPHTPVCSNIVVLLTLTSRCFSITSDIPQFCTNIKTSNDFNTILTNFLSFYTNTDVHSLRMANRKRSKHVCPSALNAKTSRRNKAHLVYSRTAVHHVHSQIVPIKRPSLKQH